MFKQVFRLTFATFIWKQYKRIIVSSMLFFAYLWFVGFAHSEYLDFASQQDDKSSVGLSFFIKWFALLLGVACYFSYHLWRRRGSKKGKSAKTNKQQVPPDSQDFDGDDPFENIRKKEKLRSRSEIMIDKNKS